MKRVTGIGGIFFKAKDSVALRTWYQSTLVSTFKIGAGQHFVGPTPRATRLGALRSGTSPTPVAILCPKHVFVHGELPGRRHSRPHS